MNSISRQSLGITYEEWTKDINKCAEAIIRTTDELELRLLRTLVDLSVEAADFGQELLYFTDKAACPDPRTRRPHRGGLRQDPRIDPAKGKRMSEHVELCRKLVKGARQDKPVVAFVFRAARHRQYAQGPAGKCSWIYTAPDEVKKGRRDRLRRALRLIDQLCATGIDAVMFRYAVRLPVDRERGDVGRVRGRLHDPHRRTRALHGCAVMIHNCGQGAYFDEQYERMKPVLFSSPTRRRAARI